MDYKRARSMTGPDAKSHVTSIIMQTGEFITETNKVNGILPSDIKLIVDRLMDAAIIIDSNKFIPESKKNRKF